jgi:hypothetical protein
MKSRTEQSRAEQSKSHNIRGDKSRGENKFTCVEVVLYDETSNDEEKTATFTA